MVTGEPKKEPEREDSLGFVPDDVNLSKQK